MTPQTLRKYFEDLVTNSPSMQGFANGMLVLVDRLNSVGYLEAADFYADHMDIRINIPNHNGYITLAYHIDTNRYTVECYRNVNAVDIDFVGSTFLYNPESPTPELDEFIERVKPELQVGWK